MSFRTVLACLKPRFASTPTGRGRRDAADSRPAGRRLYLEALEGRDLPSFLAPVNYSIGAAPGTAVVTADFNGDGRADVAVHHSAGSNPVGVLLGNGDGTFQPARNAPAGTSWGGPGSLAVGDLNADGRPDLATANDVGTVSVLLGNGDGTFAAPRTLVLADQPIALSVVAGDFNADGKLDLAVGAVFTGTYPNEPKLHMYLGNGDGTFASPRVSPLPLAADYSRQPYSVQTADLNGDGKSDLVTTNFDNTVTVLLGNGDGTLQAPTLFAAGPGPMMTLSVAVADLNGDGKPDLATADYNGTSGTLSVLLGDGTGAFPAYRTYAAGDSPSSVAIVDVNGDGRRDLVTTNSGSNTVSVLLANGDGTFQTARNYYAGASPFAVAAGDFNGDGWLDAATANSSVNNFSVLINDQSWPPPPPPSVSINDVTVTEGNTGTVNATFTVSLSVAYDVAVTVHYQTANGSATAGSDYAAASGDVIIPAGQTTKTFTVAVIGDRSAEPTENFVVNLSAATNGLIVDSQGVGTILDDEPRISISDVTKAEGKTGQTTLFTFTVTLSAAYDQAVTMSFRTVNGTATTSDNDYIAKTGTLTFAPGETTKTITIEVKGDSKREANETFYLDLYGLSINGLFTKNRGIGTILNDD